MNTKALPLLRLNPSLCDHRPLTATYRWTGGTGALPLQTPTASPARLVQPIIPSGAPSAPPPAGSGPQKWVRRVLTWLSLGLLFAFLNTALLGAWHIHHQRKAYRLAQQLRASERQGHQLRLANQALAASLALQHARLGPPGSQVLPASLARVKPRTPTRS